MRHQNFAFLALSFLLLHSLAGLAQQKHTLNGYIRDGGSGEVLIGATVYVKELGLGATTNTYGFYSLTIPAGSYELLVSYVGFNSYSTSLSLKGDQRVDVELQSGAEQLQEVVVNAEEEEDNKIISPQTGTVKLDINTINRMPAFLGEPDIVKSIQMMPGVSTVGEGASGFNVRGGTVGQNLLLLDEAPVYNASHMLGFFSAFNPDAVRDVKLYKGSMPSRFGGRLASLLDIRMKEGNNKKTEVQGGIGTIFSRISVEAPIVKNKSSFIVAGRRSYADILAAPALNDLSLNFYDLTAKANYAINDKNKLYLSGYFGRDNFGFAEDQGLAWGSQTGTLRWNSVLHQKVFGNLSVIYSNYDYQLEFGDDADDRIKWNSNIRNLIVKPEVNIFLGARNQVDIGGELIYYTFNPATTTGRSAGEEINNKIENRYGVESAAFINHNLGINDQLSLEYGIRLSNFRYVGQGTAYTLNDTIPGARRTVIREEQFSDGETIASYTNWEPRVSANYKIGELSSIKAGFTRTAQYIHLVSNTIASNPLDIWTPSSNNIRPQTGNQYSLGYFKNFQQQQWEASIEGFYRTTDQQIDYINGAQLLQNRYLEADLLSGSGRAYGLEVFIQRKTGRLTGWASYTLSRSELKINGINRGDWYPALYDQPHNLKLAGFYQINPRWSVSSNFVFATGTPITAPTSKYYVQGIAIPHNTNSSRNNYRLTNYHRLDLAFRLEGREVKRDGRPKRKRDYWVFSLYNVYGRRNAFIVDFQQVDGRYRPGQVVATEAVRTSILGSIVPAVSYNFKF